MNEYKNNENNGKSRAKIFWKHFGFVMLSLGLAVLTVLVISLNR